MSIEQSALGSVGLAFAISCGVTFFLIKYRGRLQSLDQPNERSLHRTPVPRTGGLAICLGLFFGALVELGSIETWASVTAVSLGAGIVGVVSYMDDRYRLSIGLRFVIHVLAGVLVVAQGLRLQSVSTPGAEVQLGILVSVCLTVLIVVWLINLYNFMDGIDGLAAGMAIIGFAAFGSLGWMAEAREFALASFVVAAAASGFLLFNFPPARIFMGDVGSSMLGFLVAVFILWADRIGVFSVWVGLLIFSSFVLDATATLVRRLLKGEQIWKAHKEHYYQRLVQLGLGHKKTALIEYGLMSLSAVGATVAVAATVDAVKWTIMACILGLYLVSAAIIRAAEVRRTRQT